MATFRPRELASAWGLPDVTGSRLLGRGIDGLLEATVVGSFSRLGYLARRSVERWEVPPRVDGKVFVVTGASSGVGRAAAVALGGLGAEVWVLGRDPARTRSVTCAIRAAGGLAEPAVVDVSDGESVASFAERFAAARERLDGLVHCAGALLREYTRAKDGSELTVATHVLGPYRMTLRLARQLRRATDPTIVVASSGGMYSERFDLDRLEMREASYDGVRAYARAKRAQVVLAHEWSRRWSSWGVASYAMHPGWVDTPGLTSGLPSFGRLGPLLRRPEEGADTAVWLATGAARSDVRAVASGLAGVDGFWHDRRRRSEYYLPWTRPRVGEDEEGPALWDWCTARTGLGATP